jgi:hypothetical protein
MKTVILISAKLRAGKNQLCTYMREHLATMPGKTSNEVAVADPIKERVWQDFTSLYAFMQEQHDALVAKGIPEEDVTWLSVRKEHLYDKKTPFSRALMQIYGTEVFRKRVTDSYWVDLCVKRIEDASEDILFVTDVRYENELDIFLDWAAADPQNRRAVTVRIERPDYLRGVSPADAHTSEVALDHIVSWDFLVDNSGTLEDLQHAAQAIAREIFNEEVEP